MTVSEAATVRPLPVRYNVQWGYKSNHSSIMNMSDLLATYSKKVRLILQKNKHLARELAASQNKISKLEKANKHQQKIEKLALPRLKVWLEAGMQCIYDARVNYARAIRLLQDIMTPERDFTLIGTADTDEPSARKDRRPPLQPQGSPCANECGNFTIIPEENESFINSRCPSSEMTALDPGAGLSSTPTILMSVDRGKDRIVGRPVSPIQPLAPSPQAVEPTLIAAEQFSENRNTIPEKEPMVITPDSSAKSGRELNGHNTPPVFSPRYEEADDFYLTEDSLSSRNQFCVPPRPRKSVGNASGSRSLGSRRPSLSAAVHDQRSSPIDASPESFWPETARSVPEEHVASSDVSLLLSTCTLHEAFLDTSSFSAVQPSPAVPEKTATSHAGDDQTLETKATSKRSSKRSRASTGSAGLGSTSRQSRDVSEGKEQEHASRSGKLVNLPPSAGSTETPSEVEKAKPPPAESQTAKTSRRRSRPYAEPVCVPPAMDDDDVPRYESGRPARRSSLGKNYKEPSLNFRYF